MRLRAVLAILLSVGTAASAGYVEARPLQKQLPPKGKACFERIYDAAHLTAHPLQQVTHITLLHERGADAKPETEEPLYLSIEITVRGDAETYRLGGMCEANGKGLVCTPEWEAGSFLIEPADGGALLVTNKSMVFNPNNHDAEEVAPNAIQLKGDDKAWKLFPGGPQCGSVDKPDTSVKVPTPR